MSRPVVIQGDARALPLPDESVDCVVTDPPYGLEFMGKEWDAPWKADTRQPGDATFHGTPTPYGRSKVRHGAAASYGGDPAAVGRAFQAWCTEWATEALRVLKPGGHLLAFGGTRTYHRLACAIEDAGFEIRDSFGCLSWVYASGFPKSLDVSKAIDKGRRRDYVFAALRLGMTIPGRNLDDWTKEDHSPGERWWAEFRRTLPNEDWQRLEREVVGVSEHFSAGRTRDNFSAGGLGGSGQRDRSLTAPATEDAARWQGWGTALKPAWEPIVVARKPLAGTVAANVLRYGTGAINVGATRVEGRERTSYGLATATRSQGAVYGAPTASADFDASQGRWPTNLVLLHAPSCEDGGECHPQCHVAEMDRQSGTTTSVQGRRRGGGRTAADDYRMRDQDRDGGYGDSGGASRYFPTFRFGAADQEFYPVDSVPCPLHGEGSTRDASTSAGRRAASSDDSPPTGGSGSRPTGPSPTDTRYITETTTRSTTTSATSCASPRSGTTTTTSGFANSTDGSPGSRSGIAPAATDGCLCRSTTSDGPGPGRATADPVSAPTSLAGEPITGMLSSPDAEPAGLPGSTPSLFRFQPKADTWERPTIAREGAGRGRGVDGDYSHKLRQCNVCGSRRAPHKPGRPWPDCEHDDWVWAEQRDQRADTISHPTVKPVDLMRWLVRLVTPPGGLVLDPFAGSGATLQAAQLEGFRSVGVELDADHCSLIAERLSWSVRIDRDGKFERIKPKVAADLYDGDLFSELGA